MSFDNLPIESDVVLRGDSEQFRRVVAAEHAQPHSYLGTHLVEVGGVPGVVIRGYHPDADTAWVLIGGTERPMKSLGKDTGSQKYL